MKKLDILFFDLSTSLKTVTDLESQGRGGMVTSLFKVSDYLASRGHRVKVISDIENPGTTCHGTEWIWRGDLKNVRFDALILNRGIWDGRPELNAKRRILWTHDLPHNGFIPEPMNARALAATVFMSAYAERVWRAFYPAIGTSVRIPNGVDTSIFKPGKKDMGLLIYASAPNRGLKRLPLIYEAVKARTGMDIRMVAYSNMMALHPNEVNGQWDNYGLDYKNCLESGIDLRDPMPQWQLAEVMSRAALMVLPTDYPEICSNIVIQALACGTPIVTTGNLGATGEWVKHGKNGWLTQFMPHDYMVYQLEITRAIVAILSDNRRHIKLINNAAATTVKDWGEIGGKWERMLNRLC